MKMLVRGVLSAALISAAAYGGVIVDFTVSANSTATSVADVQTVAGDTWTFSLDNPLIPSTAGSLAIYGGIRTSWAPDIAYNPIVHLAENNGIRTVVDSKGTYNSLTGVFVWLKSDFAGASESDTISFKAGDSLSMQSGQFSGSNKSLRFVVSDGGNWYVSNTRTTSTTALQITDMLSETWYALSTNDLSIGASGSTLGLNDIQAVGFYVTHDNTVSTAFRLIDFEAVATIPEPATIGIMGIGALLALIFRRLTN